MFRLKPETSVMPDLKCRMKPLLCLTQGAECWTEVRACSILSVDYFCLGIMLRLFCSCAQIFEEELGGVKGHFGPINALAFVPDGRG